MSKPGREKSYIGDGVYVSFDGWHVVLTTVREAGHEEHEETIYLEPSVYLALKRYADKAFGIDTPRDWAGPTDAEIHKAMALGQGVDE